MSDLSGYEKSELLGETPALLQSGEHDDAFYEGCGRPSATARSGTAR